MKKITLILLVFLLALSNSTLLAQLKSPLQPVGRITAPINFKETTHNWFVSGRLSTATHQRDSLYVLYNTLKNDYDKDTTQRGIDFRTLQDEYNKLNDQYKDLDSVSDRLNKDYKAMSAKFEEFLAQATSTESKLNIALQQKNKELLEREKRLKELESIVRKQDSISKALKDLIKKALLDFNSQDLTVELKNGKVYIAFSDEFLFKSGSADVEKKGLEAIKKVAEIIKTNNKIDVLIEGHTDNVPIKSTRFQDNWDLSAARAISIVRILNDMYGVDPSKLTAAGRSQFVPRANNDTSAGKSKNRRVEIVLIPDLKELYDIIYK